MDELVGLESAVGALHAYAQYYRWRGTDRHMMVCNEDACYQLYHSSSHVPTVDPYHAASVILAGI